MSGVAGGYNSPAGGGAGGNIPTSASSSDVRAMGSSTPVEHAGSTGSGEGAVDVGVDPASHNFFSPDYRNSRHEDLRQMLEGNKDQQKLEAMKRIIGMVAKGKDASDLFPAVVKNVVSKNAEVKKLVYVYLVRYAEEQQDLALLSISTFQRALKDPNQLIRASALRVLSSIRVPVIVPIMMLAIKESASDMSPYVRKTAAVAIPKMYSLDPEQKEECVQVIEKLLADRTTLVAGAVVAAFEEVCPDRIDLIHKNYRKLCSLLVDVDEWGQVIIINMLTRYARTQFIDPNKGTDANLDDDPKNFYESDSKESPAGDENATPPPQRVAMDPDHRLLLRTCKPLLQSRNNAVVMAVAQLYYYLAPRAEVALCVRALVRLLRSHREGQYVVLSNIVSMSLRRKDLFEPYLKSFFVRSNSDPLHIRLLKLEILTNLATEGNISAILREFQTYISQTDKEFVAATIQAIGRCASNIKGVSDTCLNGLVSLLSKKDEAVVAESVVVVKKLLQTQPSEHKAIITHMAKLVHDIAVPMARASILWLLGEYSDQVPKIAPDVLRVMAKNFTNEEDIVKLQILNLAAKLHITNAKQTSLLAQYVFQLAKYDQNYDLRDRARFLRMMIIPEENGGGQGALAKHAKKIFLSSKPAPVLESKFKDSDQFQLGTLSHIIGSRANGYQALPDFPEVAPDPTVRVVEVASPIARASMGIVKTVTVKDKNETEKGFYSESEEEGEEEADSSGTTESADSGEDDSDEEESESEEEDDDEEESESESEEGIVDNPETKKTTVKPAVKDESEDGEDDESEESDESEDEDEDEDDESEEEDEEPPPQKSQPKQQQQQQQSKKKSSKESSSTPPRKSGAATAAAADTATPATPATPSSFLVDLLDFDTIGSPTSDMPLMPASSFSASNNAGLLLAPKMADLSLLDGGGGSGGGGVTSFGSAYISSYSAPLKELLGSLIGGGLVVQYRFTRAPNLHSDKAATIELVFINGSEEELKQIKIGDKRIPGGMKFYEFSPIGSLAAKGGRTAATIGVDFNDSIQKIGFDLDVGGRVHPLTLTPPVGELARACTMSEDDFAKEKKKLAGMNEHSASISFDAAAAAGTFPSLQTLVDCVLAAGAFGRVPSAEENAVKMASKSMATAALSLVTLALDKDERKIDVTVNSEKLVFGSLLLKDIKIALEAVL